MAKVIERLIITKAFLLVTLSVFSLPKEDTLFYRQYNQLPYLQRLIGTRTTLKANSNTSYLVAQTTDYGKGSWIKISNTSFGYNENGITRIIDATGQVWDLNNKNDEVQIAWFLSETELKDTADKTNAIQKALNFSAYKKLIFDPRYVYQTRTIYPSDGTIVEFNGAEIQPYWTISQADPVLFHFNDPKIGMDGKYTPKSTFGTKELRKKLKGITFRNGVFRMKNYRVDCIRGTYEYSKWSETDSFKIENCVSYNCSGRSFTVANNAYISDSTPVIKNVAIVSPKTYYNGTNIALYVAVDAKIGDTSVTLKTIDQTAILNRVTIGTYLQFPSAGTNKNIINTGYGGTNKIYRIKSFTADAFDSTKGVIIITGGSYDNAHGFIDSTIGLTANIVTNTVTLPVDVLNYSLLINMPRFNGTAGSTTLTRSTINVQQDACMKNLYPGMDVSIFNQPGNYKILSITTNAIIVDKPLLTTFSSQLVRPNGIQSDAVALIGYLQNVIVDKAYLYANMHAIYLTGNGGKGLFTQDINTNVVVSNSEAAFSWMTSESIAATEVKLDFNTSCFTNGSAIAGDSLFKIGFSAKYHVGAKDVNGDGIAEKFITESGITDAGVNWKNALYVGELVRWLQFYYTYQVVDIYVSGSDIIMKVKRWNQHERKTTAGGFEQNFQPGWANYTFDRAYSIYAGEIGKINNLTFYRNKFYPNWRKNMGGYALSVMGNNLVIKENEFYSSEAAVLETSGYAVTIQQNKFRGEMFLGNKIIQGSVTARNNQSGKGAGGIGTIASHKIVFTNNDVDFDQPQSSIENDYNTFTGAINIEPTIATPYPSETLMYTNNTISGIRQMLFTSNYIHSLNGAIAPAFRYDTVNVSGNVFELKNNFMNLGLFGYIFSSNTFIKNNKIICPSIVGPFKIFKGAYLNDLIYDTTLKYNIVLSGNTYPVNPVLNVKMSASKINWNDMYINTN